MKPSLIYSLKILFLLLAIFIVHSGQSQVVIPQDSCDLEVVRVVLPENYWLCTISEVVVVEITNNSPNPRSNFTLQYFVYSNSTSLNADTVTEIFQDTLFSGDTVQYTFNQLFYSEDMLAKVFFLIIDFTNDSVPSNNTKIIYTGQDDPQYTYYGKVNEPSKTKIIYSYWTINNTFLIDDNYSKVIVSLCQSNCNTNLSVSKCDGTFIGSNDNYCGLRSQLTLLNPEPGRYSADVFIHATSFQIFSYTLEITGLKTQYVEVPAQWSIFSTYMDMNGKSMAEVMTLGGNQVLLVKDEVGQVYWPQYNVNTIGNYSNSEAYQLKASTAFTLAIEGRPVDTDTMSITLNQGWNLLPYLKSEPDSLTHALSPILENISIIKDGDGLIFLPGYNVNQIQVLQPGKGYYIKMQSIDNLIY